MGCGELHQKRAGARSDAIIDTPASTLASNLESK
jgi:hypothetical protein